MSAHHATPKTPTAVPDFIPPITLEQLTQGLGFVSPDAQVASPAWASDLAARCETELGVPRPVANAIAIRILSFLVFCGKHVDALMAAGLVEVVSDTQTSFSSYLLLAAAGARCTVQGFALSDIDAHVAILRKPVVGEAGSQSEPASPRMVVVARK
jgi:hypothetical protein